jgi:DNA-binding MurR/RpiR family transcriptional regulator
MIYYQNETKQNMFNSYNNMTPVERSIADFFLSNTEKMDFSSKNISKRLYVSEAALSRFSKKCGYKGYRELIFSYEKDLENDIPKEDIEPDISSFTKKIKGSYASILQEEFGLLNEKQIRKVVEKLENARKIYIFGIGSPGLIAKEFQQRFIRIGLPMEAVTDAQLMQMCAALTDEETLVIAISLSGKTKGASVVYITTNENAETAECCDELIRVAGTKNAEAGNMVSPQFSLLMLLDVLFAYYFANNTYYKVKKYKETMSAVQGNAELMEEESS